MDGQISRHVEVVNFIGCRPGIAVQLEPKKEGGQGQQEQEDKPGATRDALVWHVGCIAGADIPIPPQHTAGECAKPTEKQGPKQ